MGRVATARGWRAEGLEEWDSQEAVRARREAVEACARRVVAGHDVRLMCHCYPRRCHAQGLAAWVMRVAEGLARQKRRRVRGRGGG